MDNQNHPHTENSGSGKKITGIIIAGIAVLAVGAAALYLVDVDQTEEARLPSVDVEVNAEGGNLPKFEADVADVDVGTKKTTVDVPSVDVETKTIEVEVPVDADVESEEMEVEVPTVDIEKPEEDSPDGDPD